MTSTLLLILSDVRNVDISRKITFWCRRLGLPRRLEDVYMFKEHSYRTMLVSTAERDVTSVTGEAGADWCSRYRWPSWSKQSTISRKHQD